MQIHSLSDQELVVRIESLVTQERELTSLVIDHLREIERRRLYAKLGFTSLYDYATRQLKYCPASAQLRIDAMRLSKEVPELREALEEGRVNLSTVGILQKFIRAEKIESVEEKKELLGKLENKSKQEAEKILMGIAPVEVKERTRVISESETELKLVASEQLMELIEEMRLKLSRKGEPAPGLAEVFEEALKRALKKPIRQRSTSPGEVKVKKPKRPYIPVRERPLESQCTFISPLSGQRCQATLDLHTEHIIPFGKGGSSTPENLTRLCQTHNQLRAIEEYGEAHMQRYLRE